VLGTGSVRIEFAPTLGTTVQLGPVGEFDQFKLRLRDRGLTTLALRERLFGGASGVFATLRTADHLRAVDGDDVQVVDIEVLATALTALIFDHSHNEGY
jgi:hypothetical protein